MSKHRHSKDRLFITYSEHKHEWGGKKDAIKVPLTRLPFYCCALSLEPFQNPVCTVDGHVFDIVNIIPFIKKYKKNPITGQTLKITDLTKLTFHKNDKGEYHDPVSFKVFTDYTKIVGIKSSGNVYSNDTVEELNRKPKHWKDLYTGEDFTFKDIIILQDPKNIQQRTVKEFDYLKNNLQIDIMNKDDNDISQYMNLNETGKDILEKAKESNLKRKREEDEKSKLKKEEDDQIRKKIRTEIDSEKGIPISEWLDFATKSGLFVSERYATTHDSFAVTSTQSTIEQPIGGVRFRNMTSEEIKKLLYEEVRQQKEKGYVQVIMNQGTLNLEIHADLVPITSENFLELCEKGYYNKSKFHRLAENALIEGGDPTGTGYGGESIFGKPFNNEINNKLSHNKAGVLSMSNLGPNHNTSLFFITLSEQKEKDGKNSVFGEVVGGYQVLYQINKITTNIWERPDFNIRILETKVYKNPIREAAKNLIKKKELEQDEDFQLKQVAKNDERWLENESKFDFTTFVEKKEEKPKGLGLASSLINSFSNSEVQKQAYDQKFNFGAWK